MNRTVYLVDPAKGLTEETDSNLAAKRFSDFLKIRKTGDEKGDWVDIEWKGGVLTHRTQQESCSCGVIVIMVCEVM